MAIKAVFLLSFVSFPDFFSFFFFVLFFTTLDFFHAIFISVSFPSFFTDNFLLSFLGCLIGLS